MKIKKAQKYNRGPKLRPKPGGRTAGRDLAFRLLCQRDSAADDIEKLNKDARQWGGTGQALKYALLVVEAADREIDKIDERLSKHLKSFRLSRIGLVDRNILRTALAETGLEKGAPYEVAVAEAVKLAEKYGDSKTPAFVNGVLSTLFGLDRKPAKG